MRDVMSPVSSKHPGPSRISGGQPLSPGCRSNPSRKDSVPEQPKHGTTSRHSQEPEPNQPIPGE
jgi:hypothetical protein